MSDVVTVRRIEILRAFPWLRLGRALGCALSLPALVIAVIGVLVVDWSRSALLLALPARESVLPWIEPSWTARVPPLQHTLAPFWNFYGHEWGLLVVGSVAGLLWSFFGVALCRCSATEFCRDDSASFRTSVQHAIRQRWAPLGALITPLVGTALLAALIALLAVPAWIPGLGDLWLRLISPAAALIGIAAGGILLVLPVLWPLMIAAMAVDDSDGFDAFSRSFSFVTSHPWQTAALVAASAGMTWACGEVIDRGMTHAVWVLAWSAEWTASEALVMESLLPAGRWWVQLFARAIQSSLFWSLATVVYLFLRQSTDGAPLDQLSGYDDPARAAEAFPVVGIPAMTPPVSSNASAPAE